MLTVMKKIMKNVVFSIVTQFIENEERLKNFIE